MMVNFERAPPEKGRGSYKKLCNNKKNCSKDEKTNSQDSCGFNPFEPD
jgi:hypothetical protein